MRIPRLAYQVIADTIRDSVAHEPGELAEAAGISQSPEAREIMERMHALVADARVVSEQSVDLKIELFSKDDVSCLMGIVTGVYLVHRQVADHYSEEGDFDNALAAAMVARDMALTGTVILRSRKSAALN